MQCGVESAVAPPSGNQNGSTTRCEKNKETGEDKNKQNNQVGEKNKKTGEDKNKAGLKQTNKHTSR